MLALHGSSRVNFFSGYTNTMGNVPSKRGGNRNNHRHTQSIEDKIKPLAVFSLDEMSRDELIEFMSHPTHLSKRYRALLR